MKKIKEKNCCSNNILSSDTVIRLTADARRVRSFYILQLVRMAVVEIKKPFETKIKISLNSKASFNTHNIAATLR
jgi:hypothetical protein